MDLRHNEEDNKRSRDNNKNNSSVTSVNSNSSAINISAINISQDAKKCPPPKFRPSQFNKIDWTDDKERLKKLSNKSSNKHQHQQHEWTDERANERANECANERANERANLVQNDARLKALLAVEVQKSGVVTTVGYNAVLQKFLMSDEVEKEMANDKAAKNIQPPRRTRRKASARRQQQQHGLMGRLVSSYSSVPTSRNGDMTSAVTSAVNLNRRGSVDCDSCHVAPNLRQLLLKSPNIDDDVGGMPSSFEENGRSRDNIAPRKMKSFRRGKQQEIAEIVSQVSTTNELQIIDMRALQALQESESLDRHVQDNDDSKSPIIAPSENNIRRRPSNRRGSVNSNRRGSVESLTLEDVFNGADGTKSLLLPPPPSLRGTVLPVASFPPEIVDALGSNNISYNDNVILEHDNHDDDTASIGNKDGEGEDLVSLPSKASEDGGWLASVGMVR